MSQVAAPQGKIFDGEAGAPHDEPVAVRTDGVLALVTRDVADVDELQSRLVAYGDRALERADRASPQVRKVELGMESA